jgi:hypothetical protein
VGHERHGHRSGRQEASSHSIYPALPCIITVKAMVPSRLLRPKDKGPQTPHHALVAHVRRADAHTTLKAAPTNIALQATINLSPWRLHDQEPSLSPTSGTIRRYAGLDDVPSPSHSTADTSNSRHIERKIELDTAAPG